MRCIWTQISQILWSLGQDGEYALGLPLGWEFQFLVPISGTPIGRGIPIPFLIPKIPVGKYFLNSAVEKLRNRNFDSKIRNSEKKSRNSIHLILRMMSILIGQPIGLTMSNHIVVGTIPGKGNLSA